MTDSAFTWKFGKHKGKDIKDLPDHYLEWILKQDWFHEKFAKYIPYVEKEIDCRKRMDKKIEKNTPEEDIPF